MTDIFLSSSGQPISQTGIDCIVVSGRDELIQEIKNEAITQEGDLFYDQDYGWSLLDFKNAQITELDELEIKQRIKTKLQKYEEIKLESIEINIKNYQDKLQISFRFNTNDNEDYTQISINIDRINAEVIIDG